MKQTLVSLFILLPFSFLGGSLVPATQETVLQEKSIPIVTLDSKGSEHRPSFMYTGALEQPFGNSLAALSNPTSAIRADGAISAKAQRLAARTPRRRHVITD